MKPEIILCECNSMDHQVIITQDPDYEDLVFVDIHLASKNLSSRIKYALKYIFGYKSRYGAWDEIILSKDKLKDICKNFL